MTIQPSGLLGGRRPAQFELLIHFCGRPSIAAMTPTVPQTIRDSQPWQRLHNILWEGPNPGLRRYRRSCAAGPYAALLELYTTAAEGALGNARRYLKSRAQIEQLRTALESREVIDQAKGMLMVVYQVNATRRSPGRSRATSSA
jgi:ANTAR domain-containing protein